MQWRRGTTLQRRTNNALALRKAGAAHVSDGLNCELPSCVGLVRSSLNFRRDVAPSRASEMGHQQTNGTAAKIGPKRACGFVLSYIGQAGFISSRLIAGHCSPSQDAYVVHREQFESPPVEPASMKILPLPYMRFGASPRGLPHTGPTLPSIV